MCWMFKPFWGEQASSCGSIWSAYWRQHTDQSSDLICDPILRGWCSDLKIGHPVTGFLHVWPLRHRPEECWIVNSYFWRNWGVTWKALSPQCCPPVVILRCCRCIEGARWVCQPSQSLLPLVGFTSPLAGQGRVMHSAEMWHDIHSMF